MIYTGTYVHPDLISHIASWISSDFAIYISKIINEWRTLNNKNEYNYWSKMGDCVINNPNTNEPEEQPYRDKIALEENGEIEVKIESGYIDVLTDTKIIEVKKVENWKSALGQVLSYGLDIENLEKIREKWIYLFGEIRESEEEKKNMIERHCNRLGVKVRFL